MGSHAIRRARRRLRASRRRRGSHWRGGPRHLLAPVRQGPPGARGLRDRGRHGRPSVHRQRLPGQPVRVGRGHSGRRRLLHEHVESGAGAIALDWYSQQAPDAACRPGNDGGVRLRLRVQRRRPRPSATPRRSPGGPPAGCGGSTSSPTTLGRAPTSWPTGRRSRAAIDFLQRQPGVVVGVYSTPRMWARIMGDHRLALAELDGRGHRRSPRRSPTADPPSPPPAVRWCSASGSRASTTTTSAELSLLTGRLTAPDLPTAVSGGGGPTGGWWRWDGDGGRRARRSSRRASTSGSSSGSSGPDEPPTGSGRPGPGCGPAPGRGGRCPRPGPPPRPRCRPPSRCRSRRRPCPRARASGPRAVTPAWFS